MRIETNLPLCDYTTFRIGGAADFAAFPECVEDIVSALSYAKGHSLPVLIMGNGSNLLVRDGGFRGFAIILSEGFSRIETNGETITAEAGALLSRVAQEARINSLTGFEFAAGIPGSVGGAVTMNAGAYGGQISDVLTECVILRNGELMTLQNSDMQYGYRQSTVLRDGGIVLRASFGLAKGDSEEISAKMKDLAQRRREKQPLSYPSAGSVFKRPEGYFAGKLIEDAGLKGFAVGGAVVSPLHAGFIVNQGGATAKDVLGLISHIQETVFSQFGVSLECEVRVVGND